MCNYQIRLPKLPRLSASLQADLAVFHCGMLPLDKHWRWDVVLYNEKTSLTKDRCEWFITEALYGQPILQKNFLGKLNRKIL